MADFRMVVSDSKTAHAYQVTITGAAVNKIIGKKIGDTISGDVAGLSGYTLRLTGGTDKDGFPMRSDLPGPARKKILVVGGVGFRPVSDGVRIRRTMRGHEVSSEVTQINTVIAEYGQKPLDEIFPKKELKEGEIQQEKKSREKK